MKKDGIKDKTLTLYEDALYSEKALFWKATQWRRTHYVLGVLSTVLSVVAGAAVVKDLPALAGVLTTVAAVLTALLTFLDPKTEFAKSHECGVKYGALRTKIERFKDIDLEGRFDEGQARETLERLAEEKAALQTTAPHTGGMAYYFAKKSIRAGQHKPD